jgi:hypothetical protein
MKFKLILFAGLALLSGNSCRKETHEEESRLALLTGTKWILTNLYHQESGDHTITDLTTLHYTDCEMDDSYNFTNDHIFSRRDSTNRCASNPHFGLYGSSNWSTDSAFSRIVFTSMLYKYDMEIQTLNQSTLELKHAVVDYFNTAIFYTYRFKSVK